MKDRLRYWWNWLLAQGDVSTFLLSFVIGAALGVVVYDMRSDWLSSSLLASLQAECRTYLGPRAVLTYNDGLFGCVPVKE